MLGTHIVIYHDIYIHCHYSHDDVHGNDNVMLMIVMMMLAMMMSMLRELRELDYSDFKASSPCSCIPFPKSCEVFWFLKY